MEEEGRERERFKKSVEVRTLKVENPGEKKNAKNRHKSKMRTQQRTSVSEEQCAERSSDAYETRQRFSGVRAENA